MAAALERTSGSVTPTEQVDVPAGHASVARLGSRDSLRWVLPYHDAAGPGAEERRVDALARVAASDGLALPDLDGGRFVGAFRAAGLLVPVWDVPEGARPDELTEPARAFWDRLVDREADESPLSPVERAARGGVLSRQLTLR